MAKRELPDQALLLKLLRYEPETGKLYWRARDASMFKGLSTMTPEQRANRWNAKYAGAEALTVECMGYKRGTIFNAPYRAHRVIFCMFHGWWPEIIDHIDMDRSNNRIENLAAVSREENSRKSRISRRNKSGVMGVYRRKNGQWRARIRHGGRYIELGDHQSFEKAVRARQEAEIRFGYSPLHGKLANFGS